MSVLVESTRYVPFFFKLSRLDDLIYRLYETIRNTMKPIAREKMIEVILLRSLCAVKFLRTSMRMLECSKERRACVRAISRTRWRLKERSVRPKSMPSRIMKKMRRISLKFRESMESGRK